MSEFLIDKTAANGQTPDQQFDKFLKSLGYSWYFGNIISRTGIWYYLVNAPKLYGQIYSNEFKAYGLDDETIIKICKRYKELFRITLKPALVLDEPTYLGD